MNSNSPVIHVITTIERGGAENQLVTLTKQQRLRGRKVTIFYLKGSPQLAAIFESFGVETSKLLSGKNPFVQTVLFRRYLREHNAIVHAHLPRAELIARLSVKKHLFVVSRHNAERFFPKAPQRFSSYISRFVTRRALRVIAISKAVCEFLILNNEINDTSEVEVIYYGYERIKRVNARQNTKKITGPTIGTISRLAPQKDLKTLLSAFSLICDLYPKCSLSIVGNGRERDNLIRFARELKIDKKVFFLGKMENVYSFLQSLDVFVLTSKYEGFGLVLLEAIDCGVPVVASRNTSIIEVLGENFPGLATTGDVLDFHKKILHSLNDVSKEESIKMQDKRLVLFNPEKMCSAIDLVYEQKRVEIT